MNYLHMPETFNDTNLHARVDVVLLMINDAVYTS